MMKKEEGKDVMKEVEENANVVDRVVYHPVVWLNRLWVMIWELKFEFEEAPLHY